MMGLESLNIELISGLAISNGYRDVSVPVGISIASTSPNSQNLYMKLRGFQQIRDKSLDL
jgi:hypothetical protein